MYARLARWGGLLAVLVVALSALSAPSAFGQATVKCSAISGYGSSLQGVAQEKYWSVAFHNLAAGTKALGLAENECGNEFPTVTYNVQSSGKGLEQFGANKGEKLGENGTFEGEEFIGDDVGPETTAIENMSKAGKQETGKGIVAVPVAQSGISINVSTPEGCHVADKTGEVPKVSNQHLFEAYTTAGSISWATLLEGVELTGTCSTKPLRLARESGSGTTCAVKRYFAHLTTKGTNEYASKVLAAAECESAATTSWPTSSEVVEEGEVNGSTVKLEKGSQLVQATFENPDTISYADLADTRGSGKFAPKEGLTQHTVKSRGFTSFFVQVGNSAYTTKNSTYVSPEDKSEGSNCTEAEYKNAPSSVKQGTAWFNAYQTNIEAEGKAADYPICTMTFDDLWHNYEKVGQYTAEQAAAVYNYILYIVKEGQGQGVTLKDDHYGLLSPTIQKEAVEGLKESGVIVL
jgi:hypothetical protein